MSVTVTFQGRRGKIALGSAHVAVTAVVARAKAHFGLEGSFGLRTTRGRRADVPDAAAWAHTGLSNNCELELVRRAGGGGAVRVAAAVSHLGSAPRTVSFTVDAGTSLAAVVERLVAEGAAPPDPLRRAPTVRGRATVSSRTKRGGPHGALSALGVVACTELVHRRCRG